jgi:predicted transcriptional regulator
MNVLTLKIPDDLDAALQAASRARGLSKSAVVREALEQSLGRQADRADTAQRWVAQWRGRLATSPVARKGKAAPRDERLAHLMAKHVR